MIPKFHPCFDLRDMEKLLSSEDEIVEKFEKEFAHTSGYKFALSFPYGRSSLYSIFKSLNISNSQIIIPSYMCMAVPSTIVSTGNIPVFSEISLA